MKKFLFVLLGLFGCLSACVYWTNQTIEAQSQNSQNEAMFTEPYKIAGTIRVEGKEYKWMEASFGGKNRGYEINPGKHRYQLSPNPHNDPWYNKNQTKFYKKGAEQIEKQANTEKWNSNGWPTTIKNITINKITYTLTK